MIYSLAYFFSWLGDWERVTFIGLVLLILFLQKGWKNQALLLLYTVLLAQLLSSFLKVIFERNRPDRAFWLIETSGYSFPSGHATVAMALYGGIAYLLWVSATDVKVKYLGTLLCVILIFGIGLSRIILRVHWITDVLGGWVLGLGSLVFIIFLFRGKKTKE